MVNEEYFKKLETKYVKYWYVAQTGAPDVIELAREIAKYTDEEKKVTRIVNGLRRGNVHSIEDLMEADIDELAKVRNLGHDALNILRQIKGLPIKTYADEHPFTKSYKVEFFDSYDGRYWLKEFCTLRELNSYFASVDRPRYTFISQITEVKKENTNDKNNL